MYKLEGKRILVTGAAGGLGSAVVSALADQGAQTVGLVKSRAEAAKLTSRCCRPLVADLLHTDELTAALQAEISENGPFYGLVNNAAIYPKAAVDQLQSSEFVEVLSVNVIAAAAVLKACLPSMLENRCGRILNIASNTFDMGMEELSAYVASKGALIGLTRVWARELGPYGITVNAIAPGAFNTDAEKIHPDPEAYSALVLSRQALKRRGRPEEFAGLVTFLLGEGSAFITGQTIRIDGGWVMQ